MNAMKFMLTPCVALLAAACVPHGAAQAAGAPAAPAQAAPRAVLTLAEQPLRLVRGATVYKAGGGIAVQKDDILETGAGGAQVEAGPDAIVALGPQTRVLVAGVAGALELNLLQGWTKVQSKGRIAVTTPALQVALPAGSTIVAAGVADGVFAEEGEQSVARIDDKGRAGAPLKLPAEQYAGLAPNKPQPVAGRPPREFVGAMPRAFRDRLARMPAAANAGKVQPAREREADFADVDAWLQSSLPARRGFAARFKPRLNDAAFRAQLDRVLGQSADWKPVLHPARPAANNTLF